MAEKKAKPKAAKKPVAEKKQEKKPAKKAAPAKEQKKPAEKKPETKEKKPTQKPKEGEPKAKEAPAPKTAEAKPKKEEKTKEKKEDKEKKVHEIAKIQFAVKAEPKPGKYKPRFRRQEAGRYKRLEEKWRRPTGIDSKKLEKRRGKGLLPGIGYKKPVSESGLQFGFEPVRVFNVEGLKAVKSDKQAAVIAAAVGRMKRNMIIEEANKLKIRILNPRRGEA